MAEFQALLNEQNTEIYSMKRVLPNLKKLGQSKITLPVIERRINQVSQAMAAINKRHAQLLTLATAEIKAANSYFTEQQLDVAQDIGDDTLDHLHNLRVSLSPSSSTSASVESNSQPQSTSSRPAVPFPAIKMPTFDGSPEKWTAFHARFTSLVIQDKRLNDFERLHYLCSSLSGEASGVIETLEITAENFSIAWAAIQERYDNERRVVDNHLRIIFNAPSTKSTDAASLSLLRDSVYNTLQALKKINRPVETWDDLLVYIVTGKLDSASRADWELTVRDSRKYPTFAELDKFLQSRVHMLESLSRSSPAETSSPRNAKAPKVNALSTTTDKMTCIACKQSHPLFRCTTFQSHDVTRRRQIVANAKKCMNCFRSGHSAANCTSPFRCRECKERHHSLLHVKSDSAPKETPPPVVELAPPKDHPVTSLTAVGDATKPSVLLATATVKLYSQHDRSICVRALLDQGSEITIISEHVAQALRLPRSPIELRIDGIGSCRARARHAATVQIGPTFDNALRYNTSAIILPSLSSYTKRLGRWNVQWKHLRNLQLADDNPFGAVVFLTNPSLKEQPSAGFYPVTHAHHAVLDRLSVDLTRFWEIETLPVRIPRPPAEEFCEQHFLSTHSRQHDGRYIVRLPFRSDPPIDIGESRAIALHHLVRQENRVARDAHKAQAYADFLAEYETLGHMVKVSPCKILPDPRCCYIPHHAVFRESSSTTRLRVVFNASSKTANGSSLNDQLLPGPKLQIDIRAIILRWRQFRYVLISDIAKMYRQILVDPRDQPYQRILWRPTPSSSVEDYQLQTVTYGTACAPFLALRVLQQLAIDEGAHFPLAVPIVEKQMYVDDCLLGANRVEDALQARNQIIALLNKGGFRLRKWAGNNPALLRDLPSSDCGLARSKEFGVNDTLTILGIAWHPERDVFRYKIAVATKPALTKRAILSSIATIFDPLGWLTPVVVGAKILLQELWKTPCGWDDELPPAIKTEWLHFRDQLPRLETISIPRWTFFEDTSRVEIHGFADASNKAYAATVYSRVQLPSGSVQVSLLIAKSKVAPIKPMTIPRLELCAALLLAELINYVREALNFHASPFHCWSDSTVVLEWLRQPPARWSIFIANRVVRNHELAVDALWHHISTLDNPADCASRGIQPSEIHHHPLWWSGPAWLVQPSNLWPKTFPEAPSPRDMEEKKRVVAHTGRRFEPWDLQLRFSSWSKLLRVTALVIRFIRRTQTITPVVASPADHRDTASGLYVECIRQARTIWIKRIQDELFFSEIHALRVSESVPKSSPLLALSPYLDSRGVLRARGRLRRAALPDATKHPIILGSHPLVRLLIFTTHLDLLHAGPQVTLTCLRRRYWILRARPLVRSVLYKCVACAREDAKVPEELMGDLPSCRVNPSTRAFVHSGVDYAGPMMVRRAPGRGQKSHKAYVALFICMTTRAVHLELVSDYTTGAFLAAYQRFASRRGLPTHMYSDNGTTFHGAERELATSYRSAIRDPDFAHRAATEGVTWHFLPPASPHFGGLWEAAVRSVKRHLKRCIGCHTLTFEEFSTLLCRIEACLNSRPIAAVSDNLDDYQALTPGHFLIHTPLVSSPEPSVLSLPENRLSRWQVVQRQHEQFWVAWSRDYLHGLQQRPKWRVRHHLARVGQLVLIREPGLPPSHWTLGRIIMVHPGEDGLIRVVTVKTSRSEFKRPIVKLCFLPVDINAAAEMSPPTAGGTSIATSPTST